MDVWLLGRFVSLFFLLFFSAVFSGAEVAFFSLTPVQVDLMKEKEGKRGRLVAKLLSSPRRLLVTIYIGNELINVAIAAITTILAFHYFGHHGLSIGVGIGTFILLIFGEITPKTFALKNAQKYALLVSGFIYVFSTIISPIQAVVTWLTNLLISLTGASVSEDRRLITEDEIKTVLEHGEDKGIIKADEKEMIFNIFELGDTLVTDIMTPRTEIFSLPIDEGTDELIKKAIGSNFSRIPVYRKNPDDIVGVLYTKDLLKEDADKIVEKVEDLLHDAYQVPVTKKIDELFREFQKKHIHMAVVLDEYGGVDGLVTMDDILEEVVGEAPDRKNLTGIKEIAEGRYLVPGRLSIEDFNEYFKTKFENEEIDTVGGLVFHLFGRMPSWGESITAEGITFSVDRLKGSNIWRLAIKVAEKTDDDNSQEETDVGSKANGK